MCPVMETMAARTNKTKLDQKWREKIRTSMLINRLSGHVVGRIKLDPSQVRAAEVLLKKTLPDLSHNENEITGAGGEPIATSLHVSFVTPEKPGE